MTWLDGLVAAASVLAALWSTGAAAQTASRTEGLAEPERVLREVTGADAADSARQRYATLLVLSAAARRAAGADAARPGSEDAARITGYNRALQQLLRDAQAAAPDCRGDACPAAQLAQRALELARSPGFGRGVLDRFASPAWRQQHLAGAAGGVERTEAAAAPTLAPSPAPAPAGETAGAVAGRLPAAGPPAALAAGPGGGAVAAPTSAVGARPAAPGGPATDPPHLAGMPTAEAVRGGIRGDGAQDSAARQYAALVILMRTVGELSDGREMRRALTADETARRQQYLAAMREIEREQCPEGRCQGTDFNRLQLRYSQNSPFRKELFERLTTAAWREKHVRDWHELVAQHGAAMTTAPKLEARLEMPTYTPPPSAEEVASNPLLSVFGLGFDQPFTLPRCAGSPSADKGAEHFAAMLGEGDRFCYSPVPEMLALMYGVEPGSVAIHLPRGRCPAWVNCMVYAKLEQGRLRSVTMTVLDEGAGTEALVQKYGAPTTRHPKRMFNRLGMNLEFTDLEWSLKDVYAYYTPMTNANALGRVTIKGPTLTRRERNETQRQKANELKF